MDRQKDFTNTIMQCCTISQNCIMLSVFEEPGIGMTQKNVLDGVSWKTFLVSHLCVVLQPQPNFAPTL